MESNKKFYVKKYKKKEEKALENVTGIELTNIEVRVR